MISYTHEELKRAAELRHDGYYERCLKVAHREQDGKLHFTREALDAARRAHPHHGITGSADFHISPNKNWFPLGNWAHAIALPIAKLLRLKCIDPKTGHLRAFSPCSIRRKNWNELGQKLTNKIKAIVTMKKFNKMIGLISASALICLSAHAGTTNVVVYNTNTGQLFPSSVWASNIAAIVTALQNFGYPTNGGTNGGNRFSPAQVFTNNLGQVVITNIAATNLPPSIATLSSNADPGITNAAGQTIPQQITAATNALAASTTNQVQTATNALASSTTNQVQAATNALLQAISNSVYSSNHIGNGSNLLHLQSTNLEGQIAPTNLPSNIITNGETNFTTISNGARVTGTFEADSPVTFNDGLSVPNYGVVAGSFSGDGSQLTNLSISHFNGTIPFGNLPTNIVTNTEAGVTLNGGTFSGSFPSVSYPPYSISSLANGENADLPIGTNSNIILSGPTAAFTTDGINGSIGSGHTVRIEYDGPYAWTIRNQSGLDAIATNRVMNPGNGDIVLDAFPAVITATYSAANQRWILNTQNGTTLTGVFSGIFAGNGSALTNQTLINVLAFGAVCDGTTDNTSAFSNALATHVPVYVPGQDTNGNIAGYVVGNLTLSNNVLFGYGAHLIFGASYTNYMIQFAPMASYPSFTGGLVNFNRNKLFGLELDGGIALGTNYPTTMGTRHGVYVDAFGTNSSIYDCQIHGFSGVDVFIQSTKPTSAYGNNTNGPFAGPDMGNAFICGLRCSQAYQGIATGFNVSGPYDAEYLTILDCYSYSNYFGDYIGSGNIGVLGGSSSRNYIGVCVYPAQNDGHGFVNDCFVNHNNFNVAMTNITAGFQFHGDHFIGYVPSGSTNYIVGCARVDFMGYQSANTTWVVDASTNAGVNRFEFSEDYPLYSGDTYTHLNGDVSVVECNDTGSGVGLIDYRRLLNANLSGVTVTNATNWGGGPGTAAALTTRVGPVIISDRQGLIFRESGGTYDGGFWAGNNSGMINAIDGSSNAFMNIGNGSTGGIGIQFYNSTQNILNNGSGTCNLGSSNSPFANVFTVTATAQSELMPSNSLTTQQIATSLTNLGEGSGWIGMISNALWSYKLSNSVVISNKLN